MDIGYTQSVLWSKTWVVDVEDPLDNPEHVIEYVGRYTHRVAISNHRILNLSDGNVTFAYKNREKKTNETMTITAVEFIRRFLLHVLPKGFMRIRYYGFLANRCKRDNLKICRRLLAVPDNGIIVENKSVREIMLERTGRDITKCPFCKNGDLFASKSVPKHTGTNPYDIIHGRRQNILIQRE